MSGATGRLYLDQLQTLGIEGAGLDRGYPPLPKAEMAILRVVADNLFVTVSALSWATFEAMSGKSDSFKAIRERLLSKSVKLKVED
jgi:hypothetical protein